MFEKETCKKELTGFGACIARFESAMEHCRRADGFKWQDLTTLKETIKAE